MKSRKNHSGLQPVSEEEMQQKTMDKNSLGAAVPGGMSGVCWVTPASSPSGMGWQGWIWVRRVHSWALTSETVKAICTSFPDSQGPVAHILWEEPFAPQKSTKATLNWGLHWPGLEGGQCWRQCGLGCSWHPQSMEMERQRKRNDAISFPAKEKDSRNERDLWGNLY